MRILITATALFTGLQILPIDPRVNPYANPSHTIQSQVEVPAVVDALLKRSCYNCHSNETRWPWYSNLAPASWLIGSDVNRARSAMNFSDWSSRPGQAMGFLAASCAGVQTGRMPPRSYRLLHPEAAITQTEALNFCSWTASEMRNLKHRPERNPEELPAQTPAVNKAAALTAQYWAHAP